MSADPVKKDLLSDSRIFNAITICFLLLSFTIAMVVDDLGVVLAMVGATGSTLVSYILPGLIYVKLQSDLDPSKIMAYLQLSVGCLIMPFALYFVIMGKITH
jgi:amino acid permease